MIDELRVLNPWPPLMPAQERMDRRKNIPPSARTVNVFKRPLFHMQNILQVS